MPNRPKPITKTDKNTLDNFIEFVNADIEPMDKADFVRILIKYTELLRQFDANYPDLSLRGKYKHYTGGIMEAESSEILDQRKGFFIQLQSHIRSRLQTIINAVESGAAGETVMLIEMKGSRRVFIDPNKDRFFFGFWPDTIRSDDQLNIKEEKGLADLIFLDYIRTNEFIPSRFGKCGWEKCE